MSDPSKEMKKRIISPFLFMAITAICYFDVEIPNLRMEIIPFKDICFKLVLVDMSQTRILAFY